MASTKEYREANREKINAYWTKYREANREKINAAEKLRREANPKRVRSYSEATREKINTTQKKYREANREKINARSKAWREANPERFNDLRNEWNKLHIDRVTKSKVKSELKRQLGFLPADDLINSLAMLRKIKATIKELSK